MKEHEIGPDLSLHAMWEAGPVATAAAPLSLVGEGAAGGQARPREHLEDPVIPVTVRPGGVPSPQEILRPRDRHSANL